LAIYVTLACRCLIGVVFAVSAVSKVRSLSSFRAFAAWLASLPMLSARARAVLAPVIAAAEIAIAVLVAQPWTVTAGMVLAAVVMAVFAVGTGVLVRRDVRASCQCFGPSAVPLGIRHVGRNAALCAAAVTGAIESGAVAGPGRPAGTALSLGIAAVAALVVVFLDDLSAVLTDPADSDRGLVSGRSR
jgi:hypothetical protein